MLNLDNIKCFLRNSPDASIILSPDAPVFTIAWANPSALSLVEAEAADLNGKSVPDVFGAIHAGGNQVENEGLQHGLNQTFSLKTAMKVAGQQLKKPSTKEAGQEINLLDCSIYPLLDEHDEVLFIVINLINSSQTTPSNQGLPGLEIEEIQGVNKSTVALQEVTAKPVSQQEPKQQSSKVDPFYQKISNILESITDGFYAMDRNWKVTYWNKEAERILQRPREAIIGINLWEVYLPETHAVLFAAYQKAMSENISVHLEMHYAPMNAWMEVSAFPSDEGLSVYFKDITSRKQIEGNLKEAKEQYQELFDLSPLPQWVYDADDLSFIDVNQAAIAHYGYSKAEFLSMTIRDIRPREDVKFLEEFLSINVKKGVFHKVSARHVKKTGEIINVQVEGNSIVFEGKDARLVLAVDVTEKLKAQLALTASEQKFKALVQDGSDLLAILDNEGNYVYVNHTYTRILEYPEEAFIGKNAFDFIHEDDKERVIFEFGSLATIHTLKIAPYRYRNGQGKYIWIDTIITNMMDDPAVAGVVANSRDVSRRIENEQLMQQSIERYNVVSKATSDAIWDYDLTTDTVLWNKAAIKLFGYKETYTTYDWWREKVHPDDLERIPVKLQPQMNIKENRFESEYRFRCADGSYKSVLDRVFLMFNEVGEPVRLIGSMQDITERVMHVQTVETQNQRLKEIAWTQSHGVRAPLARIMGIVDLLSYEGAEDNPNAALFTHLAASAAELDAIIREISKKTEVLYKGTASVK